jgi:hypothetical protein
MRKELKKTFEDLTLELLILPLDNHLLPNIIVYFVQKISTQVIAT